LPEGIDPLDLDDEVRVELKSLGRGLADAVAARLVATGELVDIDAKTALEHALVARRLAARIPAVREAVGIAAYLSGEWQLAIAELRTYHRLSGKQTHIAMIADCERAQGRPERAIDLYRNMDQSLLDRSEQLELLIVAAGARMDLQQVEAALAMLRVPELDGADDALEAAPLRYAYADVLVAIGRRDEAYEWFAKAAAADTEGETDAADRLLELDGIELVDGDDEESSEFTEEALKGELQDEVTAEAVTVKVEKPSTSPFSVPEVVDPPGSLDEIRELDSDQKKP
jgi:tetratricopeptide (TPR) repeat protein